MSIVESSLLNLFRLSKHENTIEFTFFGIIKLYIEGPIWDIWDQTPPFSGSLNMWWGNHWRWSIPNIYYPPQSHLKRNRYSPFMVGGNLREVGHFFGKHYGNCFFSPLNMAHVCVLYYSWVIYLYLIHTIHMIYLYSFIRRVPMWSLHYVLVLICSSQCCQVIFCASQCSREVSLQTNHSAVLPTFILMLVCTHFIYHLTSLSCFSFMSMMGDTSWPSFDKSVPVDFNTLSRN